MSNYVLAIKSSTSVGVNANTFSRQIADLATAVDVYKIDRKLTTRQENDLSLLQKRAETALSTWTGVISTKIALCKMDHIEYCDQVFAELSQGMGLGVERASVMSKEWMKDKWVLKEVALGFSLSLVNEAAGAAANDFKK